ncbi:MAG: hypothetical protein HF973_16360 [Chloroflexi bacterium]|nr:hypothetical protein [Chloroflexota bacterium]
MSTQATKVLSIIGLIILGVILFLGGMFFGRAQTSAAFYPGSMMFGNTGYRQRLPRTRPQHDVEQRIQPHGRHDGRGHDGRR